MVDELCVLSFLEWIGAGWTSVMNEVGLKWLEILNLSIKSKKIEKMF